MYSVFRVYKWPSFRDRFGQGCWVSRAEVLPAGPDLQDGLPDFVDFGFAEALDGTELLFGHHLNALHRADARGFQLLREHMSHFNHKYGYFWTISLVSVPKF